MCPCKYSKTDTCVLCAYGGDCLTFYILHFAFMPEPGFLALQINDMWACAWRRFGCGCV